MNGMKLKNLCLEVKNCFMFFELLSHWNILSPVAINLSYSSIVCFHFKLDKQTFAGDTAESLSWEPQKWCQNYLHVFHFFKHPKNRNKTGTCVEGRSLTNENIQTTIRNHQKSWQTAVTTHTSKKQKEKRIRPPWLVGTIQEHQQTLTKGMTSLKINKRFSFDNYDTKHHLSY